jgi:hypothetical protein
MIVQHRGIIYCIPYELLKRFRYIIDKADRARYERNEELELGCLVVLNKEYKRYRYGKWKICRNSLGND